MKIEKIINDFLLEVKLRHAKGTWRYYASHLGHFMNYARRNSVENIEEIDDEFLVEYISYMKETCENITINKNIGSLKIMYRTLGIKNEYLQSISKFKVRQKTFDMVSEDLLKSIRKYAKGLQDIDNGLFYKTLLLLLMDTGARIQELLMIKKQDINIERQEITLSHTKTKEDRVVFISDVSIEPVIQMMQLKTNHPFLLHNKIANRQGNYDDVRYIMRKLKRIFKIDKLHAHMFRHSLATIWLQNGGDIKSVMDYMGHKNMETTERYLHVNKSYQRTTYDNNYKLD